MPYPTITQLPDPPQRGTNPQEFTQRTNALFAAQQAFVDDVNAAGDYFSKQAGTADEGAAGAQASKEAAELAARNSSQSALSAQSSAGQSADSADLAQAWASSISVVEGNLKSARSYAQDAQAAVAVLPAGTINDNLTDSDKAWSGLKTRNELDLKRDLTNNEFPRYNLQSAAITAQIDLSQGNVFQVDARNNSRSLTFSNLPSGNSDTTVKLYIQGNNAVNFTNTVLWTNERKPDLGNTWTVLIFSITSGAIYGNKWGSA